MNKYNITYEINNFIYEANDCTRNASEEISIEAGKYGYISLFPCKKCIPKFKES
jgi:hypothetical protein